MEPTKQAADPGMPQAHIDARRTRIFERLGRPPDPVAGVGVPLARERAEFLIREAEDLYWNELAWEELTDEERIGDGHLTELVFPGFLALIDGLLLETAPPGSYETPTPRPEVVEAILVFLAERYAESTAELERGADSEKLVRSRAMTASLIDLVLYRLYRITPDEREEMEGRG
jgi:hypothetical protein